MKVSKALSNLLVVVENYPDLKASTNFTQLSDELSGTENRIAVARRDYNDAVKTYNLSIKQFPNSILAGMLDLILQHILKQVNQAKMYQMYLLNKNNKRRKN